MVVSSQVSQSSDKPCECDYAMMEEGLRQKSSESGGTPCLEIRLLSSFLDQHQQIQFLLGEEDEMAMVTQAKIRDNQQAIPSSGREIPVVFGRQALAYLTSNKIF